LYNHAGASPTGFLRDHLRSTPTCRRRSTLASGCVRAAAVIASAGPVSTCTHGDGTAIACFST
jgi:hypothetical protein